MHPDIRPDDGVLDVVALRAAREQVWFARGRSIRIESAGTALPTQLDGDVVGTTPLDIRILPGALSVFVDPKTTPQAGRG
jgi:diacylglycerol kinase family enzyme